SRPEGGVMGWFLRKLLRVGPLRVNLSRRGLGAPVGVKGGRLGVDATGKPYVAGDERFNDYIRATEALSMNYHHVAVEIPPGRPQIKYYALGNQWTPRGDVLRCVIDDGRRPWQHAHPPYR